MNDSRADTRSLARIQPALRPLAIGLVLLAAWLGWNAWQQWSGDRAQQQLESARDQAVQAVQAILKAETGQLTAQLAKPDTQTALAAGEMAAAATAIGQGWGAGAGKAEVWPASLEAAYAGRATSGYGRIAAAEAALAAGAAVARVAKADGAERLLVAAPTPLRAHEKAVAIVSLPMARLEGAVSAVPVAASSYLGLRQGDFTIAQRGDTALAAMADVLAIDIPGSEWRMVAALPERALPAFGLGAVPAAIAALVSLLLAGACLVAYRRSAGPGAAAASGAPTLTQALQQNPLPAAIPSRPRSQDTPVPKPSPRQTADAVAIDPGIFRAYDIRGVVGQTLDVAVAEHIGQAIGSLMQDKALDDIVVGRDGRLSGPDMVGGLIAGLRKAGRNVIDIGLAPTPLVYFGSYYLRTGCCVAVTGSHNPPDYNGFKIVVGGETLSGEAITDLYERIAQGRLHTADEPGSLGQRRIDDDYLQRIAGDVQLRRPLKVVVDAGNGVAGDLGPRVLQAIGAEVVPLYCEVDGTFPNHHPDPSEPHNLEDLVRVVREQGADVGLAFDGDGDRLGVVTAEGENIFPDRLLMLFAADVLERVSGAMVLYDVKCTGHLAGHISAHGGQPLMWKTGHSLIKAKMRETGAALAGEMSGHFFFGERWYGFDDGIYSAARLLEILAGREQTPTEVLKALPGGVSTPEIKIEAPAGDPHGFVDGFRSQATFQDATVSDIDGVRVDWADGWGLVRASNTTPVLVLRFDADDAAALARIQATFRAQLLAYRPDLPVPF